MKIGMCLTPALLLFMLGMSDAKAGASGTGFYINDAGYIITANHVIDGCTSIFVRGAVKPTPATLVAQDSQHDLALLRTDILPQRSAALREPGGLLLAGEEMVVMGYPGFQGKVLNFVVKETAIGESNIPLNSQKFLQFNDSAEQGNSGGPLLDKSGNVVGMVAGYFEQARFDPTIGQHVRAKKTDVAVLLGVVKDFIRANQIYFNHSTSLSTLSTEEIKSNAVLYTVNVLCE